MDNLHILVINNRPTAILSGSAEVNFFVVEEEVFVHSPQHGEHPAIEQHAGAGDPRDRAGPSPPTGLVFPPRTRYQLLPGRPDQAGEDTYRRLSGSVWVQQFEPDDTGSLRGISLELSDPRDDRAEFPIRDEDVGVENQEPRATSGLPAGVHAGGEASVVGSGEELGSDSLFDRLQELGGRAAWRCVIDDDDLADSVSHFRSGLQRPDEPVHLGPTVIVDDDNRQQRCPLKE